MDVTCHDCGQPAQTNRIPAQVGGDTWHFCQSHGEMRWQMGCDKSPGWLKRDNGPLPE